jgi:hypothetical protein
MTDRFFKLAHTNGSPSFRNYPEECPECRQIIDPIYKNHFDSYESRFMYVFFKCPSSACRVGFVYEFEADIDMNYYFKRIIKGKFQIHEFSDHIRHLSENFCKIYNEAQSAEDLGLLEICGIGYRKALEYLIKDYIISIDPEKAEEVKAKFLSNCIKDYVVNENIKNMAKRASWLGNDETHYVRMWGDKDRKDLKLLLNLTIHWIEMEIITKQMINEMPEKK